MRSNTSRSFVFILFQDLILVACIIFASYLRYLYDVYDLFNTQKIGGILVMYGVFKLVFHYFDMYEVALHISFREFIGSLLKAFIAAVLLLTAIYYFYPPAMVGQYILAMTAFIAICMIILYRVLWSELSSGSSFTQNVIVLGTGRAAQHVLEDVLRYSNSGYQVLGVISEGENKLGEILGFEIIGQAKDLPRLQQQRNLDLIIVALDEQRGNLPTEELMEVKLRGVRIIDNVGFHEQFSGKIVLESLRPSWFVFTDGFKVGRLRLYTKRIFDLVTAFVGLIFSAPLWLIFSAAIKLTSPGHLFYRQERVGLNGRTFELLKLRSMYVDAEKKTGPVWAAEADPRITPVGRFIRRFRIDEIPQMYNVLKGEMSFVGPRPERPYFVRQLTEQLPYYSQRHVVKPGITGWAQVRYPYGATIEDSKEKLQLDLYYIKHTNLGFDIKILLDTLKVLFRKMAR